MSSIYNYLNFREYLHDFYVEKKTENRSYSYQVLANKAGFKSKSFLADVIDGKKNLSEESVSALAKALALGDKEFTYFSTLVSFNQARSHRQRDHFFKQLVEYNQEINSRLVLSNQYEFYSQWHHSTIRELVTTLDFKDDFAVLGNLVRPSISARLARQSVELLLKLGMVTKVEGRYIQTDPDITTGDAVSSIAIENFHLQNLDLAGESIDNCPTQDRDISCIVASLTPEKYDEVKREIRDFRKRLVAVINRGPAGPVRVYHVGVQLFPTSNAPDRKASGHE